MNEWTLALSAAAFVLALLSLILLLRLIKRQPDYERLLRESWSANLPALKTELTGELRASRGELTGTVQTTMKTFADSLALAQTQTAERQDVRLRELIESLEKNQLQLKSTIAETNRILAERRKNSSPCRISGCRASRRSSPPSPPPCRAGWRRCKRTTASSLKRCA